MIAKQFVCSVALGVVVATCAGSALAQEQVIKIGSQNPLTGSMARAGTAMVEGVKVAIHEANEKYDGKFHFDLLTIDDESSPAKAVAAVQKMASEGVVAITGGYGSGVVGPASATAAKLGIPYIDSGAGAAGLTHRGYDSFFRIINLQGYSKAIVGCIRMLDKKSGVDTVSILYANHESPTNVAHMVEDGLSGGDINVVMHRYQAGAGSYTSLINRVRLQDDADVVVIAGYENDYIGILRAASLLKPDFKAVIGAWALATVEMNQKFNKLVQNVLGTTMLSYPPQFSTQAARKFADGFKKFNDGNEPGYLSMFGYVQTKVLVNAIVQVAKTGKVTGQRITDALKKVDVKNTLIGRVSFDEAGDNAYFAQRVGQHQGDRIEIVWPDSVATADINLPARSW